jgi:membrane dipeptidase
MRWERLTSIASRRASEGPNGATLSVASQERESARRCAKRLAIPLEAAELFQQSDVIDLHIDSFIWRRLLNYDLSARHGHGRLGARFYSQVDVPRLRQVGVSGATWVITTNPLRTSRGRVRAFGRNLVRLKQELAATPGVRLVKNHVEYVTARREGLHAAFLGVQGGSALDRDLDALDVLSGGDILRVTLVHLYSSRLGRTSSPLSLPRAGLSSFGRDYIRRLNALRIAVDLAHISRDGFFSALDVHDRALPPIVTHTGLSGVTPHWRNLEDDQLRAIAECGGVVGIMYHMPFLTGGLLSGVIGGSLERVVDHIEYGIKLVGDDHIALGSDWDGAIVTPRDMPTCVELPRLVASMLRRGLGSDTIQKVLGKNFLRVLRDLRGR